MLAALNRLVRKDIVKVFSLTAISTIVKMFTGFVSIKIISGLIGPSGIALLGQLSNFSSIFLTIATGGINSGVIKYVAEDAGSKKKVSKILRSALWITLSMSLIAALILLFGAKFISTIILHDAKYSSIFTVLACTLTFYSLNGLLLSVLNGYKEFRKYVTVNILSSLTGLIFACSLAFLYGVYGALLSAVTFESVVFLITLRAVMKTPWWKEKLFFGKFSKSAALKLASFSLMAFTSAATVPVGQIVVRNAIINYSSLTDAGLWEGMNRISAMYLLVITSSLSVYYLPRLSEISNPFELKREIISTYKVVIPPLLIVTLGIYWFRHLIIQIVFNDKFQAMQNLFAFQLIGDFFKISSWILSFQMLAKSMTKTYVITEIGGCITYVGLALVLINSFGNMGATLGYALCYILYFLVLLVLFRKQLFFTYEETK